ncbi:MAG: hypothetical protein NVS2B7_37670 [Herpetosiphon sp.]
MSEMKMLRQLMAINELYSHGEAISEMLRDQYGTYDADSLEDVLVDETFIQRLKAKGYELLGDGEQRTDRTLQRRPLPRNSMPASQRSSNDQGQRMSRMGGIHNSNNRSQSDRSNGSARSGSSSNSQMRTGNTGTSDGAPRSDYSQGNNRGMRGGVPMRPSGQNNSDRRDNDRNFGEGGQSAPNSESGSPRPGFGRPFNRNGPRPISMPPLPDTSAQPNSAPSSQTAPSSPVGPRTPEREATPVAVPMVTTQHGDTGPTEQPAAASAASPPLQPAHAGDVSARATVDAPRAPSLTAAPQGAPAAEPVQTRLPVAAPRTSPPSEGTALPATAAPSAPAAKAATAKTPADAAPVTERPTRRRARTTTTAEPEPVAAVAPKPRRTTKKVATPPAESEAE